LADPRIRVVNTDGRLFLKQTLQRFDVVIVDTPDPATSQLNRFFTVEFFAEVKRVLRPAGVLSFPLGRYENFVGPQLARLLACAHRTARQAFANVRLLPGGRVFFLASDGPLFDDVAGRLEAAGIRNRQVKRPYLEAMLAPDRMADMGRAITVPAGLNEDLAPVLYYYHLIHWLSQFQIRFGLLGASLLALFLFYLFRLRPAPLAVFASGFAASALEVVLLLGFQALHGSLYQQLGIVVTLFMAGLAAGAWLANRCGTGFGGASPGPSTAARTLACLAFALALLALLLPLLLHGLGRLSASPATAGLVPWVVPVLAFILALLVGAEFPLANQLEFRTAASTAARLYTADFLGASLGALLAGTLLIPLLGAPATCWLTAALNLVAALALRRRV
jgi:spermidine synthase